MNLRAVIMKDGDWWIGWLADVPGVNAQEHTREKVLESLKIGFEDLLTTKVDVPDNGELVNLQVEVS